MSEEKKRREWAIAFLKDLAIAVIIFIGITAFIKPTVVRGDSMVSTLVNGDYVIALKQAYRMSEPKPGDIIVFKSPVEDALYIKRVIATEGQNVRVENGRVYVNENELNEEYIGEQYTDGDVSVTVPEDEVFVLGDNREVSMDSRDFGCVKESSIKGKAAVRLFPDTKVLSD